MQESLTQKLVDSLISLKKIKPKQTKIIYYRILENINYIKVEDLFDLEEQEQFKEKFQFTLQDLQSLI
jgi:hypothetical protein